MDVSVLSKDAHRSLRSSIGTKVLGDGLLERTRSKMLALLGLTGAVGMAMIALALNQGWPLIAGAPIPGLAGGSGAVGDAAVAAPAPDGRPAVVSVVASRARSPLSRGRSSRSSHTAALGGSRAPHAAGLVVSHPTPTGPTGVSGEATPDSSQPAEQPAAAPPAPEAAPSANPVASSSQPVAQGSPESPVPAQAPPPVDNGEGQDHGRHLSRGGGHGHGHSGDGDNSGAPESSESPKTIPAPSEAPPPEAGVPEESGSDGGQSHVPSWGHGYGHGHR